MRRKFKTTFVTIILFSLSVWMAYTQDIIKPVVADCHVKKEASPQVQAQNILAFKHNGASDRRIYLRFDISGIDTSKIVYARLILYMNSESGSIDKLDVFGVENNSWDEVTAVWPGPDYNTNEVGTVNVQGNAGWKVSTNLLDYVKSVYTTSNLLSIAIFTNELTGNDILYFDSKETDNGDTAKIEFYYEGSEIPDTFDTEEPELLPNSLVKIDTTNNRLVYYADAKRNIIPDFSYVGYKNGETEIPTVEVVKEISPLTGNNYQQIQAAIDEVALLPLNQEGFRGAILFKAGTYKIGGKINITKSGIVLRGEGIGDDGTILIDTLNIKNDMFGISGSGGPSQAENTRKNITDNFVPVGARKFNVSSGHSFMAGDAIILTHNHTWLWVDTLEMRECGWEASYFTLKYRRKVTAVDGNLITIDCPLVEQISAEFGTASIAKYTWSQKIENVGIENLRLESVYAHDEDENHGWTAIKVNYAENIWFRNMESRYFAGSTIETDRNSGNISILNCRSIDPKATMDGGRKSPFSINGERNLVKDCYGRGGRHDYVTGAKTAGPNAFVNCVSENQLDENGPHQRWATGILWDNINSAYKLNGQNRGDEGSGQGWPCGQSVYWNCYSQKMRVDAPAGHINWVVGCVGTDVCILTGNAYGEHNVNGGTKPSYVAPKSLYEKQLEDRLAGHTPEIVYMVGLRKNFKDDVKINVYPNPTHGSFTIEMDQNTGWESMIITNMLGHKIAHYKVQDNAHQEINLDNIPDGVYFLTLLSKDRMVTKKIVKK